MHIPEAPSRGELAPSYDQDGVLVPGQAETPAGGVALEFAPAGTFVAAYGQLRTSALFVERVVERPTMRRSPSN